MSSLINSGRKLPDTNFQGGIFRVFIANGDDIGLDGLKFMDDGETISGITSGCTVYEFKTKGISTFTQTQTVNQDNGVTTFEQVLVLNLIGMDAETNAKLRVLGYQRPKIFVQTNNDGIANGAAPMTVLMGKTHGAKITTGAHTIGANQGDSYNYQITFSASETQHANPLNGSTFANPFIGLDDTTPWGIPEIVPGT